MLGLELDIREGVKFTPLLLVSWPGQYVLAVLFYKFDIVLRLLPSMSMFCIAVHFFNAQGVSQEGVYS